MPPDLTGLWTQAAGLPLTVPAAVLLVAVMIAYRGARTTFAGLTLAIATGATAGTPTAAGPR